ncbi:hypothetical protein GCM10011529_14990 [Polymorphobacter glacialis]|uniref:YgjP-like metallopeptidase domain-containing protein n=1 Tax=Sandarakinorhabdus glacialis TaxID=1614636 RepID=A0A916ZS21_9SPHN|nr:SprT family zinc-dependent metalloprotease [Polymorphobacter glacialis]GGE09642.1 hypothetical protein GCM10011529_14990 [Polymorphobacter glacialis]
MAGRVLPVIAERRRGARGIRLRADSVQGAVRISLPARGGVAEALTLLDRHRDWLAAQVAAWPRALPFVPGAIIPFNGADLHIDWQASHSRTPLVDGDTLHIGGPRAMLPGRVLRWLRATALIDVTVGTHEIAALVGRPVTQVRIGDPRARWGSCASGGRIAYSWRLILAPPEIRRNVVAHEVAHLVHANHGPDFHALLASLDPNGRDCKRWLARHGAGLHWVGRETA